MTVIAIILAFVVLLALAARFGVDSRLDRPGRQL
jgi:hypothetical protein